MSRENVDAVLRGNEAFNRGDDEGFASIAHPEVQWESGLIGTPTYHGREGIRQLMRDVRAAWIDMQAEIIGDPIDLGEWIVWECRLRAKGRMTGAAVEGSQFFAVKFRDGQVVQGGAFSTKAEALEAAGVSELGARTDSS